MAKPERLSVNYGPRGVVDNEPMAAEEDLRRGRTRSAFGFEPFKKHVHSSTPLCHAVRWFRMTVQGPGDSEPFPRSSERWILKSRFSAPSRIGPAL